MPLIDSKIQASSVFDLGECQFMDLRLSTAAGTPEYGINFVCLFSLLLQAASSREKSLFPFFYSMFLIFCQV